MRDFRKLVSKLREGKMEEIRSEVADQSLVVGVKETTDTVGTVLPTYFQLDRRVSTGKII